MVFLWRDWENKWEVHILCYSFFGPWIWNALNIASLCPTTLWILVYQQAGKTFTTIFSKQIFVNNWFKIHKKIARSHHNIIHIRNNVVRDWHYYAKYSTHSNWMRGILCIILLVPHNTIVDLNNVMMADDNFGKACVLLSCYVNSVKKYFESILLCTSLSLCFPSPTKRVLLSAFHSMDCGIFMDNF